LYCAIFAFGTQYNAAANPLEQVRNSISSLWTQKSKKQQKAQEAWNRAQSLKQRASLVHVRLEQSQRAYLEANAIYTNFARQTKKTEAEIVRTKHRTLIVSARLKRRRILMGRRLASIQRAGKLSYMQLFLGSQSLSDLTRRATVFQAITNRDAELQNAIEADRNELQGAQNSLMAQWHKRNRLKQAAFREWLRVAQVRSKQDRLLRQLNSSKAAQISYAKEQENSSRAITRMIQGLASRRDSIIAQNQLAEQRRLAARYARERRIEYSNERDSAISGSSSGWGAPAGGGITSPFGMRFHPVLHRTKLHTGTDFGAPEGAPIYAAKSGHVIFAGWQSA
jgi:murein DD-endopeptidase MepM/ murein hydrolase activator NlpD